MRIEAIHIGMKVRHQQYGVGVIKDISEHTVDVFFDEGKRILEPETSGLEPAETSAAITGLELPLHVLINQIVQAALDKIGVEKPDSQIEKLGIRWHGGK